MISSCQFFSKPRGPASIKPRHIIFTVHGIGGTDDTFGSLQTVIEPQLEEVDPAYDVVTKKFVYPTGSDTGDVFLFSEQLGATIEEAFEDRPIEENEKISFVVHSQGGLVTTIWFIQALSQTNHPHHRLARQVQAIVTESTPFWGSKAAYFAYDWGRNVGLSRFFQKYLRMSPAELRDMALGSNNVLRFFQTGTQLMSQPWSTGVRPRMLNLAGIMPDLRSHYMKELLSSNGLNFGPGLTDFFEKQVRKSLNSGIRWESDSAVNVPNARIGFNFALGLDNYNRNEVLKIDQFQKSLFFEEVPLVVVETVHASTLPDQFMDIAWIPPRCRDQKSCNHPAYKYIFKHLAHCDREGSSCDVEAYQKSMANLFPSDPSQGKERSDYLLSQMRTFGFTVNVRLPEGYQVSRKLLNDDDVDEFIQMDFARKQTRVLNVGDLESDGLIKSSRSQKWEIRIGRRAEAFSRVIKYFPQENQLRFYFSGNVAPKDMNGAFFDFSNQIPEGFPLKVRVALPGLKPRVVEAPLQPTYTTFVDLKLDRQ